MRSMVEGAVENTAPATGLTHRTSPSPAWGGSLQSTETSVRYPSSARSDGEGGPAKPVGGVYNSSPSASMITTLTPSICRSTSIVVKRSTAYPLASIIRVRRAS